MELILNETLKKKLRSYKQIFAYEYKHDSRRYIPVPLFQ